MAKSNQQDPSPEEQAAAAAEAEAKVKAEAEAAAAAAAAANGPVRVLILVDHGEHKSNTVATFEAAEAAALVARGIADPNPAAVEAAELGK
jgi:hypothetical protein